MRRYYMLAKKRKGDVIKYFKDMVSFDYQAGNPIKDDEKQKHVFHSMILNLEDVKTVYEFFKDFQDQFTTSKQATVNLCKK